MEYDSVIKRNKFVVLAIAQINFKDIMLSEITQARNDKYL